MKILISKIVCLYNQNKTNDYKLSLYFAIFYCYTKSMWKNYNINKHKIPINHLYFKFKRQTPCGFATKKKTYSLCLL